MPPAELGAVLSGQVLLDQRSHVAERFQRQKVGDGEGARQGGYGLAPRDTRGLPFR